ncbi:uncharacterized protein LY89DRAFT_692331 [Mollisia scopiformis]|uniref:Uncharacterized protein n=1 Tax=Mollisia scopiformis TaxID=149040 RepID=A0A132B2V7_MOLSC|nr:uncharacterized protein LY89DRAFT_692331 [Mollisia scopiformis]KUJ06722.1 hypothetical protein LY89DRAFT_692331 [Mollisia scopiformis]
MTPPPRHEVPRSATQYTRLSSQHRDGSTTSSDIELTVRTGRHYYGDGSESSRNPRTRGAFRNIQNRPPIPQVFQSATSLPPTRPPLVPSIKVSSDQDTSGRKQTDGIQDGDISDAAARSSASGELEDGRDEQRRLLSSSEDIRCLGEQHLSIDDFQYNYLSTAAAIARGYPPLNYKPFTIETWFLTVTTVVFLACIGGIVAIIIFARSKGGNAFHISKTRNHVAYRYVPPAIGTLTTIWWRMIITTLARMTPYISLAAEYEGHHHSPHRLQRILQNDYAHTIFEPIDLTSVAASGHWMLFGCLVIQFIIMIVIVPLKAVFIQIVSDDTGWTVIVVRPVGYTLIAIYATLILVTLAVMWTLYNQDTGLKWDPAAIADQLALVQGSNVLNIFQGLEFALSKECTRQLKKRSPWYGEIKLGYWEHKQTQEIWHGLACIPPEQGTEDRANAFHDENQLRRIKQSNLQQYTIGNNDKVIPLDYNYQRVIDPERYRYFSAPFLLNDALLMTYAAVIITVLALIITGLIEKRIQHAFNSVFSTWVLDKTSQPIEIIDNWAEGFKYRFLPVFFTTLFSALWIRADVFYRWTEPFSRMDKGADAKSSILLDYTSYTPVFVTFKALMRCHWRVAMFSALALISTAPPIIATGVFISTPTDYGYSISIEPINFWACFSFLILYLICLPVVRPPPSYRLPRSVRTIADVLSYCYNSKLVDDLGTDGKPIFSPQEKDDERVHMKYRICLTKKMYHFGLYLGKDGKRHIGFDVGTRDEGDQPINVIKFNPGFGMRGLWRADWGFLRKPKVLNEEV